MYIMSNPVLILSGIVWNNSGTWQISSTVLQNTLEGFFGKRCTVSAHHWPDQHNNICFKKSICPVHSSSDNFLYNWKEELLLEEVSQIPLEKLEGHHCRIIVVWEDFHIPTPNPDDIKQGSEELTELLESLKKTIKELR